MGNYNGSVEEVECEICQKWVDVMESIPLTIEGEAIFEGRVFYFTIGEWERPANETDDLQ